MTRDEARRPTSELGVETAPRPTTRPRSSSAEVALEAALLSARPTAMRLAVRLLHGDRDTAEEIVADVLARLWERGVSTGEVFGTGYAVRSVLNEARSRWRSRSRRARVVARLSAAAKNAAGERPDEIAVARADAAALLARLPAQQRRIVELRYRDGYSQTEVAAHLGIAQGTVASSAARSMKLLRAHAS